MSSSASRILHVLGGSDLHAPAKGMVLFLILAMMVNILALTLDQDDSFDQNKCVRMALVHDIGEAIIGDITPADGVSKGPWQTP